jgi:hypothetical protein
VVWVLEPPMGIPMGLTNGARRSRPGTCSQNAGGPQRPICAGHHFERATKVSSRIRNVLVAAAVLIAGVAGLFLPISVFDGGSSTVGCGNAVASNDAGPRAANVAPVASGPAADEAIPRPDFVVACDAAISGRRHWAIPLVIAGVLGMVVGVLFRGRRGVVPGA